ncbi:hypothetical protein ZIOFF_070951 [Zingiber officinale]|uniref:Retrovirus-related Pol polyprotein from transposon TNT 1-94-like beta-barrel domain-containing protein n=1 Tax=Zingiber officinale TaxID=94328 RepID=A0A8J5ETD7_ZINOF|nr:hypothetical protein ZIOFF_070951 [Zingiber officinale]
MVGSGPTSSDVGSEMMPLEAKAQVNAQPMAVVLTVRLAIDGKGKLGYLNGEIKPPTTKDPRFEQWQSQNSMVTAWLINSMDPVIGKPFIFLPTARDVWEAVRETYSDLDNHSQLFELNTRRWKMEQGDHEVTAYYNEMMIVWQELDLFEEEDWENPNDRRILGRKPLPPLREVFSEVRWEEARRYVMLKNIPESNQKWKGPLLQFVVQKSKGLGVTIAENRGTHVKTAGNCMENQHMESRNRAVITSIVPIGTLACTKSNGFWILDSGATDHMTSISQYFSSYTPSAGNQKIKIADGSFATVAGKGLVPISQSITLKDVLHDLTSGKMIGDAKQDGRLYLFNEGSDRKTFVGSQAVYE